MKYTRVINLTQSSIPGSFIYNIVNFPDGQRNIEISGKWDGDPVIWSRMNSFMDLELIICAVKGLRSIGYERVHLYVPYLLGSRSDRRFSEGSASYLVEVVAPILNSLDLCSVSSRDIHSYVAEACINNFKSHYHYPLLESAIVTTGKDITLISPDDGARKKIYDIAKNVGYFGEVIACSKNRDIVTGKIIETVVPCGDLNGRSCMIVDDICDGGATFIEIAKVLNERNAGKLYLVVTHGIFSKGFDELRKYFDIIFTTNSYRDIDPVLFPFVKQTQVI